MRVAFAGGGTGGHIYPALGIDDALRAAFSERRYEPRFFGNRRGLEATLVTTMPLCFVPGAPLRRAFSPALLRTLAGNLAGIAVALRALLGYRPALVIATGGYVCFPVVVAARLLRLAGLLECRIALLEINARPGLTNRLLGPLVDEVWITYAGSGRFFGGGKAKLTGAPVRASLERRIDPRSARAALGLDAERTTIVVMGGSQGARSINDAVAALAERPLPGQWQILQITGERDFAAMRSRHAGIAAGNRVRLVPFLPDPAAAYAAADLVVARAGASTLAELAVTGTPALLVPFPFAAEGHQAANAELFAAGGAAVVLPDADLNADSLAAALRRCLAPEKLASMRAAARTLTPAGAAGKIVDRITALLAARVGDSGSPNEMARD